MTTFNEAARIVERINNILYSEYPICPVCGGLIDNEPQTTPNWVYDEARSICQCREATNEVLSPNG